MLVSRRIGVGLVVLLLLVVPGAASADPTPYVPPEAIYTEPTPAEPLPACPAAPEAPVPPTAEEEEAEGFVPPDQAAIETRLARIEAAETCEAIVARQDRDSSRLWWVVAQLVKVEPTVSDQLARLVDIRDLPNCGDPCRVTMPEGKSEPLLVHDAASEQYSGELVSSVDAGAESSSGALWFIAALIVGLPICGLIWATVRRGL